MNKLVIDAANKNIFLVIISNDNIYNVRHENSKTNYEITLESPNEWIKWECGKESSLKKQLENIDILILNHGIYDLSRENSNYENSIEINALSKFKFLNLFEDIALSNDSQIKKLSQREFDNFKDRAYLAYYIMN